MPRKHVFAEVGSQPCAQKLPIVSSCCTSSPTQRCTSASTTTTCKTKIPISGLLRPALTVPCSDGSTAVEPRWFSGAIRSRCQQVPIRPKLNLIRACCQCADTASIKSSGHGNEEVPKQPSVRIASWWTLLPRADLALLHGQGPWCIVMARARDIHCKRTRTKFT